MDTKLLLVKSITLLYRESQLPVKSSNSAELVNTVLTLIKMPETYVTSDFGRDPLVSLRETARWMAANPVNYTYDKNELMQRLRVNLGGDDALYDAFLSGMNDDCDEICLKRLCLSYREALRTYINRNEALEIIKQAYTSANFKPNSVDWDHFIQTLIEDLQPYVSANIEDKKHPSIVSNIMFSDAQSVREAFARAHDELEEGGSLRTGWQGINRMLGGKGFRRGEFVVVPALQHNYKSGFSLDLFMAAALYNKPHMRDPTKKPLLIRISFENPIEHDIMHMYKSMAELEFGEPVDPATIDVDYATRYVIENLERNGYHINMVHIDPTEFTFRDMFDMIERLESDGYEIHMLNIDYLPMMSKKGCATGPAGVEIRDLYRRVRNFTSKRGITVITPHQLSTEAKMLTRMGIEGFVQEIANKGYYDGCRTVDQEVDVEIYIHIVIVNGEKYLTIQRGKHRKVKITPLEFLYCVYKFEPLGNIPFDINGDDKSRRAVGGKTLSEGGNPAWWDMQKAA